MKMNFFKFLFYKLLKLYFINISGLKKVQFLWDMSITKELTLHYSSCNVLLIITHKSHSVPLNKFNYHHILIMIEWSIVLI